MPRRLAFFARAALASAPFFLAAPHLHAEPTSEERATAQALFDDARALIKSGKIADACPKLEDSQRLDPAIGTLLYLADCYEKAGRTASAWAAFLEAADAAKKGGDTKRAQMGIEHANALEPSLARVRLVVAKDVPGLTVTRDGRPLPAAGLTTALPTDPGKRVYEASAPGRKSVRVEVVVKAGAREEVKLPELPVADAAPAASASAPPVAPPPKKDEPKSPPPPRDPPPKEGLTGLQVGGLVGAGVGLAFVAGGGLLGASAKSKNDAAKESGCRPDGTYCTPDAISEHDAASSRAKLATVMLVGGGVLAATGVTLFFVGGRKKSPTSAWIAPAAGPSSAALVAGGAF